MGGTTSAPTGLRRE